MEVRAGSRIGTTPPGGHLDHRLVEELPRHALRRLRAQRERPAPGHGDWRHWGWWFGRRQLRLDNPDRVGFVLAPTVAERGQHVEWIEPGHRVLPHGEGEGGGGGALRGDLNRLIAGCFDPPVTGGRGHPHADGEGIGPRVRQRERHRLDAVALRDHRHRADRHRERCHGGGFAIESRCRLDGRQD